MKYDSIYSIVNDIITKLGGTVTNFDSVYSQAKYIAEIYGAPADTKWYSVYSILIYIHDNMSPTPPTPTTQYTVNFSIGEGASGTTPSAITVDEGETITLPSSEEFSKEGYVFDGWTDGDNLYDAGDSYTVNYNITFEAVWAEDVPATLTFPALYEGYSGAQKYWNVIGDALEQNIYLDITPASARWEVTSLPDWVTSNKTSGRGAQTIHLTVADEATEFRQGYLTVRLNGSDYNFDIFQYAYPVNMSSNLNNYAYNKVGKIASRSDSFILDYSYTDLTDELFNSTGMKGITCRLDGSWKTTPFVFIPLKNNRLETVNLDATTIVDCRMSFIKEDNTNPWMPKLKTVELSNTNNLNKGIHCNAKYLESIKLGYLPDMTTSGNYMMYTTWPTGSTYLTNIEVERLPLEMPKRNMSFTGDNNLTHQSLLNIFNALPSGITDDRQIIIGATNIGKLTEDEILIATNKGWVVS